MQTWLNDIDFAAQWFLIFAIILPVLIGIWWFFTAKSRFPDLKLSDSTGLANTPFSIRVFLQKASPLLRILAVIALVIAIARPQSTFNEEEITSEGIDIILASDVSTSMLAMDFKPNRLEAAKNVAAEFVGQRPNDRIGLVVFAGESFTQCPATIDHGVLKKQLSEIKDGLIEDGTAIGMGLATAVNRLKDSEAKSKVVILLTDGVNNSGIVDPLTASEAAVQFGVRVYTIGVGTQGMAPYPAKDIFGRNTVQQMEVEIDEDLLRQIASKTGGKYFRATNNDGLRQVYDEIDEMEKSRIEVSAYTRKSERFYPFAMLAAGLFLFELVLRYLILRVFP